MSFLDRVSLIKNQSVVNNNLGLKEFQLPPHGLYLLGTFPETSFFESVDASGMVTVNISSFGHKVNKGILLFCVIKSSNGGLDTEIFEAKTGVLNMPNLTDVVSFPGTATLKMFNNIGHPMKGDSIAVYIPEEAVEDGNNNAFHPLRIAIKNTTNSYKFLAGVSMQQESLKLGNLKKKIKTAIIDSGSLSKWEDADEAMELNVRIRIISK